MPSMLRAGRLPVVLCLALPALACTSDTPGNEADAGAPGEDADRPDAGEGQAALLCTWAAEPVPPAELPGGVTLTEIRLQLRDVRAIGDSAPGDDRTYVAAYELRWRPDDGPGTLAFEAAPPGLYSRFEFRVQAAQGPGYSLKGEVDVPGQGAVEFEISDKQMLPVSLPLAGLALDVGETERFEIGVDVGAVLAVVDWSIVPVSPNGELELDESSPQIGRVRTALASSFTARVLP